MYINNKTISLINLLNEFNFNIKQNFEVEKSVKEICSL